MIFRDGPRLAGLAGPVGAAEPALARDRGNGAILDAEGCQAESFLSAWSAATASQFHGGQPRGKSP